MLAKIISGGQTGIDRGALDAALEARFPCGGACPRGRRAEDGVIPDRYPLIELPSRAYRTRTKRNVLDADGTLIIFFGKLYGGTRETLRICEDFGKPVLTIDGSVKPPDHTAVEAVSFVDLSSIRILNVAGPRESSHPGAADYAKQLVRIILCDVRACPE
jgi:hypothetical protein